MHSPSHASLGKRKTIREGSQPELKSTEINVINLLRDIKDLRKQIVGAYFGNLKLHHLSCEWINDNEARHVYRCCRI